MVKAINVGIWLLCCASSYAQKDTAVWVQDTVTVTVRAYEQYRSNLAVVGVQVVPIATNNLWNKTAFVQQLNTIAGVRMEERSPGSYRLNLRGSSLRAPFGVRNVKIYYEGIPVTDPGGNSYLNSFASNNFHHIEVLKGPGSSLYGAGTGGVLLATAVAPRLNPGVAGSLEVMGGSYGLRNALATVQFGKAGQQHVVQASHSGADGYRLHSAMRRSNLAWHSLLGATAKQQVEVHGWFSDLWYQTPGALTRLEAAANDRAARPAVGSFPSAQKAEAAIAQQTGTLGLVHKWLLNANWRATSTFYGTYARVSNPAIRNYERRQEPSLGGRVQLAYQKKATQSQLDWAIGAEFQTGRFNTKVWSNLGGKPDSLFSEDDSRLNIGFVFSQLQWQWRQRLYLSAGASLHQSRVTIQRSISAASAAKLSTDYQPALSPRVSALYRIGAGVAVSAVFSRGFSPPTIGELLPSTNVINTDLNAETATNYELGFKWQRAGLRAELSAYHFKLANALVQRRNAAGADFFVNAGGTEQTGLETSLYYDKRFDNNLFINGLQLSMAHTYSHFTYENFVQGNNNFSGKKLPGTPRHTLAATASANFKSGWYWLWSYYAASSIYLNDANTATDDAYDILSSKLGWTTLLKKRRQLELYLGIDNITNDRYSLGNDINAAGGRFFNPAPARNFFIGCLLRWR